eukprot:9466650-Pyramimonas_sp.AAC.2
MAASADSASFACAANNVWMLRGAVWMLRGAVWMLRGALWMPSPPPTNCTQIGPRHERQSHLATERPSHRADPLPLQHSAFNHQRIQRRQKVDAYTLGVPQNVKRING